MRRLLLVLLLANAAMLAWRQWVLTPETGERPPSAEDRLLALEDAPRVVDPPQPASEIPPVPAAAVRCVSIGPFASPEASSTFAEQLRAQGLSPVQVVEEGQLWAGYWLVATFDSRDEARAAAERLREGGVPDAYVIPGEETFTVSLGLFTQRQRAERLREQAETLAVEGELRDRFRTATVYRLLLAVPDGVTLPALPEGAAARDARIAPADCPPG